MWERCARRSPNYGIRGVARRLNPSLRDGGHRLARHNTTGETRAGTVGRMTGAIVVGGVLNKGMQMAYSTQPVYTPGAGTTTASSVEGPQAYFRGTSEGWPGSEGNQYVGVTPVSTDPVVATVFATHVGSDMVRASSTSPFQRISLESRSSPGTTFGEWNLDSGLTHSPRTLRRARATRFRLLRREASFRRLASRYHRSLQLQGTSPQSWKRFPV